MAENLTQTQIQRPSPIIEEAQKAYLTSLQDQVQTPLDTSQFAPSVVGKTALDQAVQQQAATQAGLGTLQFDPTSGAISGVTGTGVASFEPFLQTAQQTLGGVQPFLTAAAGRTGPTAFQAFESPYQTAVRDATLASFDEQARQREQAIKDQQAKLGVLGSGRAGVQTAEYQRKSDLDRALLQAQLNQAGFTQASDLAARDFSQQGQLANLQSGLFGQQLGLASQVPALQTQALGLGQGIAAQDFGFRQAQSDAAREANRLQQFEAIDRLARLGQGITGLTPGAGTVTSISGVPAAAAPSPLGSALTAGIGAFSLGKLFGV
tara:strand:- start:62 stop:1024 length:963 start_codon:yes stop_codon:yes gene_type:complete